jgi:hypothetical protein
MILARAENLARVPAKESGGASEAQWLYEQTRAGKVRRSRGERSRARSRYPEPSTSCSSTTARARALRRLAHLHESAPYWPRIHKFDHAILLAGATAVLFARRLARRLPERS